jgi:cysteine desulfurase family protein
MIRYFDNAASSWPKAPGVVEIMTEMLQNCTANPGRGGHQMAVHASRTIFDTRKQLAKLFQIRNPNDIFFMLNTTMALNVAIKGFLKTGDHVISTQIEHNSVRRPLEHLRESERIDVSYIGHAKDGSINITDIKNLIRENTKLIVINHSSNLLGTILPLADISELAKKHRIKILVDAAQTAGIIPIDVHALGIDMLAFPGHKGLYGPQGTGGLYVSPEIELDPLIVGGTGSKSEEILQPHVRPDRYEAGTPNTVGIAGLGAGVKYVLDETVEKIQAKEEKQMIRLLQELNSLKDVEVLGPKIGEKRTNLVSFYHNHIDPAEMAFILDQSFQIAVRAGYHCTPLAHQTAGTINKGAVRASISFFTTDEDILYFIDAIKQIVKHYHQ